MTREEIETNFSYHAPRSEGEHDFYESFRDEMKDRALLLMDTMPDCAERTIAIRHLEEAVMWANAAVARHGLTQK